MDIATITAAIYAGKSLLELGQEIADIIERANNSQNITARVLLYLDAAQAAVATLGLERQEILADIRKCDVSNRDQVEALWTRLDDYLHKDYIRRRLNDALEGLGTCNEAIRAEAKGILWRKHVDKEAAAEIFSNTLDELRNFLLGLTCNFYPGGSGGGIQTLLPIYDLINSLKKDYQFKRSAEIDLEMIDEELGKLALKALQDSSHEEWFMITGKVEASISQLKLAFKVNEP